MNETLIPEGRGKAEAMRTYLARGGGLGKDGKYRSGPMKGKTQAQAEIEFENHWQTVGSGVKDKYAARANNVLAPSEKSAMGLTPAPKTAADIQRSRMASYGFEKTADGTVQRIGTPAPMKQPVSSAPTTNPAATSGAGRGTPIKPIGTDAERAKVAQMVQEGEGYATADMGMGGWGAGVAMRAAESIKRAEDPVTVPREMAQKRDEAAKVEAQKQADAKKQAEFMAKQQAEASRLGVRVPSSPKPAPAAATAPAPQRPTPMPTAGSTVTNGMATDERMHAQGKTNSGTTPVSKAPKPSAIPAPTGATIGKPSRINSLTGLPMGFSPGDSTDGFSPEMKALADASVGRMNSAPAIPKAKVVGPPPTVAKAPPTVEQRAADEMRRQAAINANPSTVNPDDPKKFFTGRTLPLDQLVKRPKTQGIGTPAPAPVAASRVKFARR